MMRLSWILFLLWTSACTTKVDGLYVSDQFTPTQIKTGTIVAGGVITLQQDFNHSESTTYASAMRNQIREERKYAEVKPTETLVQALGDEPYKQLMVRYGKSGLDAATMTDLATKLPDVQFLALAKIESNRTVKSEVNNAAYSTKDDKGNKTSHPGSVEKKHRREIVCSMHIYDLQNKNVAFSGQITRFREASETYQMDLVGGTMAIVSLAKGKDEAFPTPEAPSTMSILKETFEGFAENFPKDEK